MSSTALIFHIQRFSIHDGPGIRTTVFFKGCSLSCFWCHNPEGRHAYSEIQFVASNCIGCGECVYVCEHHAHQLKDGERFYSRALCVNCGKCAQNCFSGTLELIGKRMTVKQVMDEILRDSAFYESSNGGITLSGGEPCLKSVFIRTLLEQCKQQNIHTALETCGNYKWDKLNSLLPFTDLVMMDIKLMNPDKHKQVTGDSNKRIITNARQLVLTDKPIIFRTPIVPTVNDTIEEFSEIVDFIEELIELRLKRGKASTNDANIQLELLPFHQLASDKYKHLGQDYKAAQLIPPASEKMHELAEIAKKHAIDVKVR